MKKKDKLAIIQQHYSNAKTTIDSVNQFIDFIENELDLEPAHVMLEDSICSDDVNSIQYPARAQEFLGPFKMGGLDFHLQDLQEWEHLQATYQTKVLLLFIMDHTLALQRMGLLAKFIDTVKPKIVVAAVQQKER